MSGALTLGRGLRAVRPCRTRADLLLDDVRDGLTHEPEEGVTTIGMDVHESHRDPGELDRALHRARHRIVGYPPHAFVAHGKASDLLLCRVGHVRSSR